MFREVFDTAGEDAGRTDNRLTYDLNTLILGAEAGAFGTLVMTVYRMPIARSLPPTAEFIEQWVPGISSGDHPLAALLLHFLYGIGGGVVFGVFHPHRPAREHEPETVGSLWGLVYGQALSIVGEYMILGRLLGQNLDEDESLVFHAGHLVYGVALGAWIGSRG